MSTERLDKALVTRELVDTRTKAKRLIEDGNVSVNSEIVTKAAHPIGLSDVLEVRALDLDVGRGAKKLRAALTRWSVPVDGVVCVDLGASTGGFTQVLLESGASTVVALDVGHGQLHESLASDSRMINHEGVSVLDLSPTWWAAKLLPTDVAVVVADLSFISLQKVIPVAVATFGVHSHYLFLVKPQFEVGKGRTSQGVLKDIPRRDQSVRDVAGAFRAAGVAVKGVIASPLMGERGNVEYLMLASNDTQLFPAEWDGRIPQHDEEGPA